MTYSNIWEQEIINRHPDDDGFLPYWDFKNNKGKNYYTIDPFNIPEEWKDLSIPRNVFELPEIWYNVEKNINKNINKNIWHEVDFCTKLLKKYSQNDINYLFEVCCGICPHGSIFAKKKYNVVGVDASQGMINAVNARAKIQNISLKAYKRDIFQFSIPGPSPDAAIMMGNTFPLSYNNKIDNYALVNQLRSVGTFLKRGSIFLIDCGSPKPYKFSNEYSMSAPQLIDIGFAKINKTLRTFPTNIETISTPYIMGYDVEYPTGRVRLEMKWVKGYISPLHFSALVEMSRVFVLESHHHWGNLEPGLQLKQGHYIAVLRRI